MTEQSLYELIDECEANNLYLPLIRTLGEVFSNIESLSRSFQETCTPTEQVLKFENTGKTSVVLL